LDVSEKTLCRKTLAQDVFLTDDEVLMG